MSRLVFPEPVAGIYLLVHGLLWLCYIKQIIIYLVTLAEQMTTCIWN